jgi:hypothetical protein
MEDFLIFVLIVAVVWLLFRQATLSERLRHLEEQASQIRTAPVEMARPAVPEPAPVAAPAAPKPVFVTTPAPVPLAYTTLKVETPAPAFRMPVMPPKPEPVVPVVEPKPRVSLEERLGANWLNKLGIATLVIGLALFLGIQLRNIGPAGKSAVGMALSLAILVGGVWLERRAKYRVFARALIGGGWALTFFCTFAMYHVAAMQVLHSQAMDLVLMLMVAGAMVAHSLRYHSQVVTSLAFLLAFVTVGISDVTLFSLVAGALLAVALAVIVYREAWFELALAGVAGVYWNHYLWLHRVLPHGGHVGQAFPELLPSAALLLLYWLIFRLVYVLRVPAESDSGSTATAAIAAVVNSTGLLALLKYQSSHPEWAFAGLLALGAAEMVLAFVSRSRKNRTAFVVLSTIAVVELVAAIPFRFSGDNWPLLWIVEAEALFIAGVRLREIAFRRLGMLVATLTASWLLMHGVFVLVLDGGNRAGHPALTTALMTTAVLLWFNGELAARVWPELRLQPEFDALWLGLLSCLGTASMAAAMWLVVPTAWVVVAWMALSLVMGYGARRLDSARFATQADALAIVALVRLYWVNVELSPDAHGFVWMRALSMALVAAMFYVAAGRRFATYILALPYVAAAYTWAAAAVVATLPYVEVPTPYIGLAWGGFALVLLELGLLRRWEFLRQQAYALFAACFVRMFAANLDLDHVGVASNSRLYTVLPLVAAYVWVYERIRRTETAKSLDRVVGVAAVWCGLVAAMMLLYVQLPGEDVLPAWAAMALVLMGTAAVLERGVLVAQALSVAVAATLRAVFVNFWLPERSRLWASAGLSVRAVTVAGACAILLLALPMAFAYRRRVRGTTVATPLDLWLARPEQTFYFLPLALLTVLLAVELRAGMITVGWSALGVVAFLFALAVKERSFRLSGLALLMLSVAKILVMDIWHTSPTDRYITLIVVGAALLLVSFLYSRYKETLLKLL